MAEKRNREASSIGGNPYPTPPNRPKHRVGSAEGTTISTGEFCDLSSDRRIGAPRANLFLPLTWDHTSRKSLSVRGRPFNWAAIAPTVHSALQAHGIDRDFCDVVYRRPTPKPLKNDEDVTILIVAEPTETWISALKQIRTHLISIGFETVQVEVIDPVLHRGATISPAPRDERLRVAWKTVMLPRISQCLKNNNYLTLGLVRRGFAADESEHPVCVLITVPVEPVDGDWPEKVREIHEICQEAGFEDIDVDIGHGVSGPA
ncbi:MAG: hypothetical protein Q9225_000468 [Loekoesia sp. 1 TL-2023]